MKQANTPPPFIAPEQLVKMAGLEAFQQGSSLLESHPFKHVTSTAVKASGDIDNHKVTIHYQEKAIRGECSCPVSDGFDFCAHCVSLCLFINKQNQQIRSLSKGPDKSKVLAYLLSLDKQTLAKHCLNLIVEDANEFERYLLKAFLHQADIDYTQLKGHITQLTRKPENLFSQRQVKVFFSKLERFLEELNAPDAPEFDTEKFQKVIEYAFQRINSLLDQIDDSSEQRASCIAHLHSLYANALNKNNLRDETQAKRFFKFWLDDQHDLLGLKATEWLTPKARSTFKSLALTQWQSFQKAPKDSSLKSWQITKLARYLFEEAIQSHDDLLAKNYRPFISKD